MTRISLLIFLLLSTEFSNAQGTSPAEGWDSLRTALIYPELARQAGLNGMVLVRVWIDTAGVVDSVEIPWSSAEIFDESVVNAVRSVRWRPPTGAYRGKPLAFPVMFHLKGTKYPQSGLLIEADAPPIIKYQYTD